MTGLRHLRHLLRGHWFRRLFAVRVTSQFADGVFQVALAAYVIFSPENATSAGEIAGGLAAILLPFSVLGPFVGVFLDQWSRRQVLAVSNFLRVGLVLALATGVAYDVAWPVLFGLVLACLSVNRFLLAGLSAALPHVVAPEDLVTANAVTPTSGTIAALVGVGVGTASHVVWERLEVDSDVAVLLTAAAVYGLAGALALRMPRRLLGPDLDPAAQQPSASSAVRSVVSGMLAGLQHLGSRRQAAYGLVAIGVSRFFYGMATVMLILLYRFYFHSADEAEAAFRDLTLAVLAAGAGLLVAAVVTPIVTERIRVSTWVVVLLGVAGVTQVVPGALFTKPALLVSSFLAGLAAQGVKICVDTLVQAQVDDAFRGRVFAVYDVVFNLAFVAAAATAAVVLPADGKSYAVLAGVGLGYVATAVGYGLAVRFAPRSDQSVPATARSMMQNG